MALFSCKCISKYLGQEKNKGRIKKDNVEYTASCLMLKGFYFSGNCMNSYLEENFKLTFCLSIVFKIYNSQ